MDGENWTVVARRRAAVKLRSSMAENSSSSSSKPRGKAPKARSLQARHEDLQECDEALLLLLMKRSMARVQESAFFKTLLDQSQSPPVGNHLRRAASAPGIDVVDAHPSVSDENKMLANLGSHIYAHASTHKSKDITLQIRSSTEDSMLQCTRTLLRVPCESTENELICNATIVVAKACGGLNCSDVECERLPEVCSGCEKAQSNLECKERAQGNLECNIADPVAETFNCKNCMSTGCECLPEVSSGKHDEKLKRVCRCVGTAYYATHIEPTKGLMGITDTEGSKYLNMTQRPCPQISEEPWCLQVVVYGLGSIADSEISRCQFALILLLKQRFAWVGNIEVYDPVLSQSECKVIADMGCSPIANNEEGRRKVLRPTLFYMPHCEAWLYDNVLQANWIPHTLGQLVILGNSFQDYQERWSSPIGGKSKPLLYVKQYQQVAQEVPLKATSSSDLPGFNNMSWHFYPQLDTVLVET